MSPPSYQRSRLRGGWTGEPLGPIIRCFYRPRPAGFMKFLFDLFPVIAFFAAYMAAERLPAQAASLANQVLGSFGGQVPASHAPILLATLVAIIATAGPVRHLVARHP